MGIFVSLSLLVVIPIVWTALFGLVTSLPFGMEEFAQILSNTLSVVYDVIPLLETPVELFLLAVGVKLTLITIEKTMWIVSLLKP